MALVVLPESPRWLVVNARLDEALAVIHRLFTDKQLPPGTQQSTAEVEQELMALWSSVEKDKAAAKERCLQMQQRTVQSRARLVCATVRNTVILDTLTVNHALSRALFSKRLSVLLKITAVDSSTSVVWHK